MRNGRLVSLSLAQECPPPPQPEPNSYDLLANELTGFGNYGVTSGDTYTMKCWRPTRTTCPGVCWTDFPSIVPGPRWRFPRATTLDPCGNFGIRLSVPLNRSNGFGLADYAYDVPKECELGRGSRALCGYFYGDFPRASTVECARKVRNTTLGDIEPNFWL